MTYPIYILELSDWKIIFPDNKEDLGHTEFWEREVAGIVASHFSIPKHRLLNLPYSQRRARIVNNTIYYGETPSTKLLHRIRKALDNNQLQFVYDNHEKRLSEDYFRFKRLITQSQR